MIPNRLKSYTVGGNASHNLSRSASPNNTAMKRRDASPGQTLAKPTGLMLRVVVLRVRGSFAFADNT